MRCPKCGYISFDHVDTCLKCNKDISKTSSAVEGTTYNVAPPSFLRFPQAGSLQEEEDEREISFDGGKEDFDVVDPDLDVLVEGEGGEDSDEATIEFGDEFEGFGEGGDGEEEDFEIAIGDDEDDSGIDLGQFEDAFDDEESGPGEIALDFPDELSDISDLSAPAEKDELEAADFEEETLDAAEDAPGASLDDDDDFNLDLDLKELGEEFSLDDSDGGEDESDDDPLGDLSLDDIGLSADEEPEPAAAKKKADPMDMDADLDFDLDLGGISLDDDD